VDLFGGGGVHEGEGVVVAAQAGGGAEAADAGGGDGVGEAGTIEGGGAAEGGGEIAGDEVIAGAGGVDGGDVEGGAEEGRLRAEDGAAEGAELDDDGGGAQEAEAGGGAGGVGLAGEEAGLVFVDEKQVEVGEAGGEVVEPAAERVPIGIERGAEAGGAGAAEGFGGVGPEAGEDEEAGEVVVGEGAVIFEGEGRGEGGGAGAGAVEEFALAVGGDEDDGGGGGEGRGGEVRGIDTRVGEGLVDEAAVVVVAEGAEEAHGDVEGGEGEGGVGAVAAEVRLEGVDEGGGTPGRVIGGTDDGVVDEGAGAEDARH